MKPEELLKHPWLELFGNNKYIIIFLNDRGETQYAVNRHNHAFSTAIEPLFLKPVQEYYHMPAGERLSSLFPADNPLFDSFESQVKLMFSDSISPEGFPKFDSRNIMEGMALSPYFSIDLPLTIITLFRCAPDRFMGVIAIDSSLSQFTAKENKIALLAGPEDRILGYSAIFSAPFNLAAPGALLGRPVSSVVRFSRNPSSSGLEKDFKPPLRILCEWKAGSAASFPFEPCGQEGGTLFSQLNPPLDTDASHFECRLEFSSEGGKIPNLVFRGLNYRPGLFPDAIGYSLTNRPGDEVFRFRKAGNDVKAMPLAAPGAGKRTLVIRKTFSRYSFELDGKEIDAWTDTVPFQIKSDDRFYLFRRPGESFDLLSFGLSFCPLAQTPAPAVPLLTARYVSADDAREFSVYQEQGNYRGLNYTLYQFHDITELADSIRHLEDEKERLTRLIQGKSGLLGLSPAMEAVRKAALTVAKSRLAVLIEGETGTGKEVLARLIHGESAAAKGPFIKIDCSTIPAELIESELFGHEKGAFTGAVSSRTGFFEQAEGGTVFLDEISNLPLHFQAKLLTVLQDSTITRVGGSRAIRVDFRLLCASNIPLSRLIAAGKFRSDLYYRMNQYRFLLPPLRERKEDIPLLAGHFLAEGCALNRKHIRGFSQGAMVKLMDWPWHGNVRELRNTILRAAVFCPGEELAETDITLEHGEPGIEAPAAVPQEYRKKRRAGVKDAELNAAMEAAAGNATAAARSLGLSRAMIYVLFRKYGVDPARFRG